MKIRINEAIAAATLKGIKVTKKELSNLLWSETKDEKVRQTNMSNLCSGKTNNISLERVNIICEKLDCTPNFLFGFEK